MTTTLVHIGNSKGIRIPKAVLEQCHFTGDIDMQVEGNTLILKPIKHRARAGWDEAFKKMHANGEDVLLMPEYIDMDGKDWQW